MPVDAGEPAQAVHRPGQGADERLERRLVPGQGVVEGAGAVAFGADKRGQHWLGRQPGLLLALVAQLAEGGRVGGAFEVGPKVGCDHV